MELPANLYWAELLNPAHWILSMSLSSTPMSLKHSLGVNFRILNFFPLSSSGRLIWLLFSILLYISHTKLSFVANVVTHPLTPPLSKAVYPWRTLRHDRHTSVAFVFPPRCAHDLLPTHQSSSSTSTISVKPCKHLMVGVNSLLNVSSATASSNPLPPLIT